MMRARIWVPVVLVVVFVIGGCAPTLKSPPGGVGARKFLHMDEFEYPYFGAYGYLIFTSRPDSATAPRYRAVCEAYLGVLEHLLEYRHRDSRELMVTTWLLDVPRKHGLAYADCDSLVAHYHYARAYEIASTVEMDAARGPLLVAWRTPFFPDSTFGEPVASGSIDALIFDLSDFRDDDLKRPMQIWRERIATDPEHWQDGFKIVKFRESVRNLIQEYGEHIVSLFTDSRG